MNKNEDSVEISRNVFKCKHFNVYQDNCTMKVNTDGMLLGAWVDILPDQRILDVGTGTGIIAIMMAQRNANAFIEAVEIEDEASKEAMFNFNASKWHDRLKLWNMAFQDYVLLKDTPMYDHIVTNPPFFSGGTFSTNENKNNVRHTVKLGHGEMLLAVSKILKKDGKFSLILPHIEGERFIDLATRYGLYELKVTEVVSRRNKPIERLLISLSRKSVKQNRDKLTIMEDVGHERIFTREYRQLTGEFYIHF